jgi:riboflavin biosynthesis pyrimidine reductase
VACERDTVPLERSVFAPIEGYARTIVLAPAGLRERSAGLETVADVLYVGDADARELDLRAALAALRERGIASVLCEGGPTLAAHLLDMNLVDRVDWLVAPALLSGPAAVPALTGGPSGITLDFDRVERLGPDVLFSAVVK